MEPAGLTGLSISHIESNYSKQRAGFSVMEVLLVVLVISIMSVAALQFFAAKAEEVKVKAAAATMRNWLQAGWTYYNVKNVWPTQTQLKASYLAGQETLNNPWGYPYNVYTYTPTGVGYVTQFGVRTQVPNEAAAKRLAAAMGYSPKVPTVAILGSIAPIWNDTSGRWWVTAYAGAKVPDTQDAGIVVGEIGSQYRGSGNRLTDWPQNMFYQFPYTYNRPNFTPTNAVARYQTLTSGSPIRVDKPTCPDNTYTKRIQVYLAGLQKGCVTTPRRVVYGQCDNRCSTKGPPWNYDTVRGGNPCVETCCAPGRWVSGIINYCGAEEENWVEKCDFYGHVDPVTGFAFIAAAAYIGGGVAGLIAGPLGVALAEGAMTTHTGIEHDITPMVRDSGSHWEIMVRTKSRPPPAATHAQLWDHGWGLVTNKQFEALTNYEGKIAYVTYCEPPQP